MCLASDADSGAAQAHLHAAAAGLALEELWLRLVDVDLELLLVIVILVVQHALRSTRPGASGQRTCTASRLQMCNMSLVQPGETIIIDAAKIAVLFGWPM